MLNNIENLPKLKSKVLQNEKKGLFFSKDVMKNTQKKTFETFFCLFRIGKVPTSSDILVFVVITIK